MMLFTDTVQFDALNGLKSEFEILSCHSVHYTGHWMDMQISLLIVINRKEDHEINY